ncbi:helix-turn-helix domain-containing protein [Lentzea sp. NEAU-D13]|uniref:Helix-turn-helix domain-containing protein n=1 Tax=Lentzea alba TaxID=2714351 RepID=A0A7C9RU54_9PSEU|nr:LuxR family transcriptional regulator [Lentzea alba]NGY63511.1 helix-turn-helix domain-containing protein [Lentzea alba]
MRLVEREEQLARLEAMFADCLAGRGRIALVSGALGSGKTALLQEFGERVAFAGAAFVSAVGSWTERGLRYGVVSQLLHEASVSVLGRRVVSAVLQRSALLGPALHALCLGLLEITDRVPLVIGVDDVDLADQASLNCLLALARRLRSARVLFLFTESAQPRSSFRIELLRLPQCAHVVIDPLTERGVATLLGLPDAERIHSLSRGNPLLARAIAEDDLPQAVLRCLHRGGPLVRHTARAIAVLGERSTPTAISRLIGVDRHAITHALRVLTAAGLLGGGRFRHAGTRDTVLADAPPTQRGSLHARAARMLHDRGEAAEVVAWHLLEGPPRWHEWVVPVLRAAAERGRADFATRCLELARKSSVDPAEKAAITADLAQREFRSNPLAAGRHLSALREALRAGHLDRSATVTVVSQLLWHGRTDDALVLARDDPDAERFLASAHPALARWRRHSNSPLTDLLGRQDSAAARRAERVLRGSRLAGEMPWAAVFAVLTLIYADRLESAAAWCERLLHQAGDNVTWQAMFSGLRAEVALRQGDLRAARRLAMVAFGLLPPHAWGTAVAGPLSCLVLACTRSGQYAEAGEYVGQPVPEAALQTRFGPHYLYARGEYHLATDRPDLALADFRACGELMLAWGQDHPGVLPWRVQAARALLTLGRPARHLLIDQLELTTSRSRTRGFALRVLAPLCDPAVRTRMLAESAEILEDRGDRFGLAHTLADLSTALGDHPRARMIARRAWHVAHDCDAQPLLPADVPDEAGQVEALTEAQRRVAALAADGHTNREIARRLFVTTSTVEQHLTHVYRKLDIKHRSELPAGSHRRPRR